MTSATSIAATEKKCRSELSTGRRGILHFSLQRLLSRFDSCSSLLYARLLSRRIALVSLRLFSSISSFRSASDPAGAQVLVVRRRMLLASRFCDPPPVAASAFHLNVSSVFCSLVPLLFLYLHTSRDNVGRRWHSKTRSFELVEILKDVVDLLFSTVLQLPRFQAGQPFPSLSPIDPLTSYRRSTLRLLLLTDLCRFNLRYRRSCRCRYHCRRRRRRHHHPPLPGFE